eukprot:COSAG06_NODE_35269_length_462_cov_0.837466_1_plen_29_part_10
MTIHEPYLDILDHGIAPQMREFCRMQPTT